MRTSEARVSTTYAERYLGQLCKHFAHKIPATFEAGQGRIEFPFGLCTLAAEGHLLILRAEAPAEAELARLEEVIASHLERFAFRDKPDIAWVRAA